MATERQEQMNETIRWLIEHKACSDFPKCWASAPASVRADVLAAWGSDPCPRGNASRSSVGRLQAGGNI